MDRANLTRSRKKNGHNNLLVIVAGLLALIAGESAADIITSQDPQNGLKSWEWQHKGVSLQLVQRLPDQTRAFFQGRGFSVEEADGIAQSCVFQSILRNDGKQVLSYSLDDWGVHHQEKKLPLQTAERWGRKWQGGEVSQAARIAFRWSLLPTRQEYQPGDYNWGMTSYGLAPGEKFDLSIVVSENGKAISVRINGIECTKDR